MSCDQSYPYPKVFFVDESRGRQHPDQLPNLVPCWSFPPAQTERVKGRGKSRGCMGVSTGTALVVLMLFLLVFAALGFEAYQIFKMQKELRQMKEVTPETEFNAAQKQIGFYEPEVKREEKEDRPAAHVIGRIESQNFHSKNSKTLRWEPHTGRAFTSGGVTYQYEDGSLRVNETGLYHIYSRVELILKGCSPTTKLDHSVFVRRAGLPSPLVLMKAHRAGFCPQQPGHSWTTESYLGSTLQLQKSDKVFVNVSHPSDLSQEHHANFFGLYKI